MSIFQESLSKIGLPSCLLLSPNLLDPILFCIVILLVVGVSVFRIQRTHETKKYEADIDFKKTEDNNKTLRYQDDIELKIVRENNRTNIKLNKQPELRIVSNNPTQNKISEK